MTRKIILCCLALLCWTCSAVAEPVTLTDLLGRTVTLQASAKRIVLGQGRYLPILGLIDPDPVSRIVGWKDDIKRDAATYQAWVRAFPATADVPSVGAAGDASLSIETVIALKPDLVILSLFVGEAANPEQMKRILAPFNAAQIPVVFVDFYANPLKTTAPSIRILGAALGRVDQAEALARFYEQGLARVQARLADPALRRPPVFLHAHAGGLPCCFTAARGVFDDMVRFAGGQNIAHDKLPGPTGQLSLEFLLGAQPDFYVATGGAHLAATGGLVLGVSVPLETAQASFDRLLATPGISSLNAVQRGRAIGVWQMFNDTPVNIVLVELLAKTFHPELFADINPAATLAEMGSRFSAVPFPGTYWVERADKR